MKARLLSLPPLALGLAVFLASAALAATEEVTIQSGGMELHGCLIRPAGEAPFPTIIYNAGDDREPAACGPQQLAEGYVERGYLFFTFQRRGQGRSPGDHAGDIEKQLRALIA
ncbi:MAG: hypothetical protein JO254_15215, partial [Pseudolabrys sp.]|nr:hypothetical protein [Pseudolabrys sp.]